MSPINSRRKGKAGELEVINLLRAHWPEARRNLEQHTVDKRDVLAVEGVHFQVRRKESLRLWEALAETALEADPHDLPVLVFRRNRSRWYAALELSELIALLRLRDAA